MPDMPVMALPIHQPLPDGERVFQVEAAAMKFGHGVLAEVGPEAKARGLTRVALFTDTKVAQTESFALLQASLAAAGVEAIAYPDVAVEPTDASFADAARFAQDAAVDGFVSLGGGSVIDTAKAANLYATHPADLLTYVNKPIGAGVPVPGPLKPHIACPTTCGTGSETTGVAVFDLKAQQVKTGMSSRHLRPTLAVIDPTTTYTLPAGVVAATGFDVLTHAIESYTARPFTSKPRPETPAQRPPYQGSNPWSDIGSLQAIRLGGQNLVAAVTDPDDTAARDALMFAATLAGLAFGNAGVHIPHAMSYSVAGLNHALVAAGYEHDAPMVPHGISVVLNAPAAFRFTGPASPERHRAAAEALGADVAADDANNPGAILADRLAWMMRATGLPNGLGAIGYGLQDIPALVDGAFAQQRLLAQSPLAVERDDLAQLYRDAMRYW